MKYKTIIQFVFGVFFLIIIFFFYYKYFSSSKGALITEITESVSSNSEIIQSQNNLIKDMSYETTDDQGNKYLIYSEYGEVNADEPDIILMKNVVAKIQLFEKDTIYINSLSAKYNIINYETNFNKDVQLHIASVLSSTYQNVSMSIVSDCMQFGSENERDTFFAGQGWTTTSDDSVNIPANSENMDKVVQFKEKMSFPQLAPMLSQLTR